jgi:F1F0 ATPase subunit 2
MTIQQGLGLLLAFLIGVLAGTVFFGGLWWTVRRLRAGPWLPVYLLTSFLLRMGAAVFLIFVAADGHWERLLACLVGLLLARAIWIRHVRRGTDPSPSEGGPSP